MAALKIGLAVVVLLIGWLGGALPLWRSRQLRGSELLGLGNALAAGLFLGAGLIHLLPEAQQSWRQAGVELPVGAILAAGAFFLILLFEHVLLPDSAHHAAHSHTGVESASHSHGEVPAYALVIALSVHSVLAGAALGVETEETQTLLTFLAIVAHKATAGFALAVGLMHQGLATRRAHKLVLLFAVMTPIGIFVGMTVGGIVRPFDQLRFDATASALAAGTFLYIGAFDLLQDEFERAGSRWLKWLAAVAGLAVTALLAVAT